MALFIFPFFRWSLSHFFSYPVFDQLVFSITDTGQTLLNHPPFLDYLFPPFFCFEIFRRSSLTSFDPFEESYQYRFPGPTFAVKTINFSPNVSGNLFPVPSVPNFDPSSCGEISQPTVLPSLKWSRCSPSSYTVQSLPPISLIRDVLIMSSRLNSRLPPLPILSSAS